MGTEEEIAQVLMPTVQAAGLEIWDVDRSGASVRVLVERPGGVDLDAISEISSAISAVLEGRDDLVPAGRYVLEVSSPGLERRLRRPEHFARSVGREVAVKTAEPVLGSRRLTGKLVDATAAHITLEVPGPSGAEGQLVQVPLPSVERAHVVFRWPAPAPSRPNRRSSGGRAEKARFATAPAAARAGAEKEGR